MNPNFDAMIRSEPGVRMAVQKAQMDALNLFTGKANMGGYSDFLTDVIVQNENGRNLVAKADGVTATANAIAKAFRKNPGYYQRTAPEGGQWDLTDMIKSGAISKASLDVGTQTNLASVTGGQTLGYVSLDTQLARATVRPNSFSLYQALNKSRANQIVDFWPYISDPGGAIPGTAFQAFGNVSTGTLATTVGNYSLQEVNLKLMVNGRAMTTALAAQNSFVDIAVQESTNGALAVLSSADWAMYHGDSTLFPNQFNGLSSIIPAANQYDFQTFYNTSGVKNGWSAAQAIYNQIYEVAAQVNQVNFGRITHAFMAPEAVASMQELVTATLNNIVHVDVGGGSADRKPIIVNGDLQGMNTRFGFVQFVQDLFINFRDKPVQAINAAYATTVAPTNPATVTPTVQTGVAGSAWTQAYASNGVGTAPSYVYAVASLDANMNESILSYSSVVTTIASGGSVTLTIAPPAANDAYAFRVYRSGNGYAKTGGANTPYSFRFIATVLANGSSNVTFVDLNTHIPGSDRIFLVDLADEDNALDYRYLLPLTKIELFAQNLYMPWAIASIGAIRVRIPQFHALINNYVPDSANWNPLSANN